jgi:hypothetical protein
MFGRIAIAGCCTPGRECRVRVLELILEKDHRFGSRDRNKSRGHVGSLSQMEECVPRLDVGLLSQQVMNTVSVTQSESASFGTAASAPAVVAAAEGAGHFGQERKVPYRHASSPFLLFKVLLTRCVHAL